MTHFKIISTSRYWHSSDLLCLSAPRCYYNPTSSHRELHSQLSLVTLLTTESNRNSHYCVSWQHHRTSCSPIISFEQEFSSTWTPSPAEAVRFSPTPGRWCPNWEPLQGGRSCQGPSGQPFWGLPVSRASEEWMYFCNLHLPTFAVFVLSHPRPPLSLIEGPLSSCGQVFSILTGWFSVSATVLFTFVATTLSRALAGPTLLLIAQPCQGCSFWGYKALLSTFYHAAIEADKFLSGPW